MWNSINQLRMANDELGWKSKKMFLVKVFTEGKKVAS